MSELYLIHHGVKDQKWGVRRWQNEDGSLTEEGKAHYGYGSKRNNAFSKLSKIERDSKADKAEILKGYGSKINKLNDQRHDSIASGKYRKDQANEMFESKIYKTTQQMSSDLKRNEENKYKAFAETTDRGKNIAQSVLLSTAGVGLFIGSMKVLESSKKGSIFASAAIGTIGATMVGAGMEIANYEAEARVRGYRN